MHKESSCKESAAHCGDGQESWRYIENFLEGTQDPGA